MITWAGFVGSLVEFILSKVVGKHIDHALDDKKQAAKAFLNLHHSLVQLESVTVDFLNATAGTHTTRLYRIPFDTIAKKADKASHLFIESFRELHQAIDIYDSTLYFMLGEIVAFKFGLSLKSALFMNSSLFMKPMNFDLLPNQNSVFYMSCSSPINPITTDTLNLKYESFKTIGKSYEHNIKEFRNNTIQDFKNIQEWPKDLLLSIVKENSIDHLIADNDFENICHLNEMVSKNLPLLSDARHNLGEFLRKNFSLEDILYVKNRK